MSITDASASIRTALFCALLTCAFEAHGQQTTGFLATGNASNSVLLSWIDNSSDEGGFEIYRKTGDEDFILAFTTGANVESALDTGLTPGTTYTYELKTINHPEFVTLGPNPASTHPALTTPPLPEVSLQSDGASSVDIAIESEARVSYDLQESPDLIAWADIGMPTGGSGGTVTAPTGFDPNDGVEMFYRAIPENYELPEDVGLNIPFEYTTFLPTESVSVLDYGATPDDNSDDDSVAIQAALDDAAGTKGVFIPAGTYRITDDVSIPSNSYLHGASRDTVTIIADGAREALTVSGNRSDITIAHLAITQEETSDILMTHGVQINLNGGLTTRRVHVHDLDVSRFFRVGVRLNSTVHGLVENCLIHDATGLGGGGQGYGISINYPSSNNNWVRGNIVGPVIRHAILVQFSTHNNLIEGNEAFDNTQDCYDIHGEDEYANEFRFNLARDSDSAGFGIGNTGATHDKSGPGNWIHHNEVVNCDEGITIIQESDVQYIDFNYFHDINGPGIDIGNGGADGVFLRGNIITNCDNGIEVASAQFLTVIDNVVTGNSDYGIETSSTVTDYLIEGNNFQNNNSGPSNLSSSNGVYERNLE